jgi:hypothetical protein
MFATTLTLAKKACRNWDLIILIVKMYVKMDSVTYMPQLREVGRVAGKKQVSVEEHFKSFISQ